MSKLLNLAIVVMLIALVLRSEIMSSVGVALASAAWINSIWLKRIERGLRVKREAPHSLAFGEEAMSSVLIRNPTLARVPWIEVRDSIPLGLRVAMPQPTVVTLGAGEEHLISYTIRGTRRGWYSIGPARLMVGDVLGIRRRRLSLPAAHVIVYPRVLPLPALGLPAMLAYGPLRPVGARQHMEDPARPAGVRQYVPGDDVRRLDWKSSARQSTLLVRRADPTIAPETTIAVAFGKGDYPLPMLQDALERAATAAASIAVALLQRKLPVSLVTNAFDPQTDRNGIRLGFSKGDAQRREILSALGRMSASDELSLFSLLQSQPLPWGGTLVLVISNLALDVLPSILALRHRGQQIALVLVEGDREALVLARQQHLLAHIVDREGVPLPKWS